MKYKFELKKKRYKLLIAFVFIIILGLLIPQRFSMPVEGATKADYNKDTFWYYPWGKSVTHKGVDIFAQEGTNLNSSTAGLVIFSGEFKYGGNVVLVLTQMEISLLCTFKRHQYKKFFVGNQK